MNKRSGAEPAFGIHPHKWTNRPLGSPPLRRFNKRKRSFLTKSHQFEHDAENSVLVVAPTIDFEGAYFACILHMGTDATGRILGIALWLLGFLRMLDRKSSAWLQAGGLFLLVTLKIDCFLPFLSREIVFFLLMKFQALPAL